jgi:hypothetical protein
MSHTDKTDPFWVQLRTGFHDMEPVHDHRTTECNLPDRNTVMWGWGPDNRNDCYWSFVYAGRQTCGCRMCTCYDERRMERRQSRYQAKALTQRWVWDFNASGEIEEWWA